MKKPRRGTPAWFGIKDELGSFWEVDGFKDNFSKEEKTSKNGCF